MPPTRWGDRRGSLDPGGALHTQALAELARVQGVVLGNVGVYLDASVDPETLEHSKAALPSTLPPGARRVGDARWRRRAPAVARDRRPDDPLDGAS